MQEIAYALESRVVLVMWDAERPPSRVFRSHSTNTCRGRHSMKTLLYLSLLGAWGLYAQTEKAQLSGTISDSSNALIPAARVTVTNSATGTRRNVHSNEAGLYV